MSSGRSRTVMVSMRLPEPLKELVKQLAAEDGQTLTDATIEAWGLLIAAKSKRPLKD